MIGGALTLYLNEELVARSATFTARVRGSTGQYLRICTGVSSSWPFFIRAIRILCAPIRINLIHGNSTLTFIAFVNSTYTIAAVCVVQIKASSVWYFGSLFSKLSELDKFTKIKSAMCKIMLFDFLLFYSSTIEECFFIKNSEFSSDCHINYYVHLRKDSNWMLKFRS